ncbi:TniQ family protein [Azospirillum argentinense]
MNNGPWPCRPKPLDDELLSSWIARTAVANGMRPIMFARAVWPGQSVQARDIDHVGSVAVTERMAAGTVTDPERARDTTLGTLTGWLFESHAPGEGRRGGTKWVTRSEIAGGIWHRPAQQFCPICLTDGPAYLRRSWRLALVAVCWRHGIVLADRCGRCASPVVVVRADDTRSCHQCGADLADTSCAPAPSEALPFQRKQEAILRRGWAQLGECHLYSMRYFDLLHHVLRLLAGPRCGDALRTTVARLWGGDPRPPERPADFPGLEAMGPATRARLLDLAARLMVGWPYRFVGACAEAGVWQGKLMMHFADAPYAFADPVRHLLFNGTYRPTRAEAEAAAAHLRKTGQPITTRALERLIGHTIAAAGLHKTTDPPAVTDSETAVSDASLAQSVRPDSPV